MQDSKSRGLPHSPETSIPPSVSSRIFMLVLTCFFISGFTGLIYEILWTRMIVKVIGSAPFAVSIVLTVFMGGLGLGSYLAGRLVDRVSSPVKLIRIYGLLEMAIGAYGLVLPALLLVFRPLYAVVYRHLFDTFFLYHLLTFAGCFLLLVFPVICMGATLPVLSRFFVNQIDRVGTHLGRLYGLNTIGAAVGSLVCGFWLIQAFGVWGTLGVAIALNAAIGVFCLALGALFPAPSSPDYRPATDPTAQETGKAQDQGENAISAYHRPALLIFAVSGFCAMGLEVIWVKLLGLIVGPTTYSFTIVLVTFISCLALGSLFFGWLGDRTRRVMPLLLTTQVAAAVLGLVISHIMGNSQIFFAKLIAHFKDHFALLQAAKAVVLFTLMFLPTFCLGASFPLVGKIVTRSLRRTGRSIGYAYAINTIGAVLGSFCAGFLLIPLIGKENGIRFIVVLQLLTSLGVAAHLYRQRMTAVRRVAVLFPFVLGLLLVWPYPHWNRKMLSIGKYHRFHESPHHAMGWLEALIDGPREMAAQEPFDLVYFGDGIGGFTTVLASKPDFLERVDYMLLNSGKADASSVQKDMFTQTLLAHFPMLFHPKPDHVLVLGLASGITSGEILNYPVKRLDSLEINKQVVAAAGFFRPWNNGVLSDPRSRLIVQDGRAHLELTDQMYDVIISEPSNPWMAGLATLFTKEFMTLARNRLNPGGIFVQWLHSYQMNWPTFSLVGRTFADVFPNSLLVSTDPTGGVGPDFLLVGFRGNGGLDLQTARNNLVYARKSANMTLTNPEIFINLIYSENLNLLFGPGPVNTDSRPYLEFSAPKLLHFQDAGNTIVKQIWKKRWFSPQTARIKAAFKTDVNRQLDFAAYSLSFNQYRPGTVNLARADARQRTLLSELTDGYCGREIIDDFSFLNDPQLKAHCVSTNLDMLRSAVEDHPSTATEIQYWIGRVCMENNRPREAIDHLLASLATKPDLSEAHKLLRKAWKKIADPRPFITMLTGRETADPDNPAWPYHLGILYQRIGDMGKAEEAFASAAGLEPKLIWPLNHLAQLAARQNRLDNALLYYEKMLALQPDLPAVDYNMACLYARQGRDAQALDALNRAVDKGYNNVDALETDTDLAKLRGNAAFHRLIDRIRNAGT